MEKGSPMPVDAVVTLTSKMLTTGGISTAAMAFSSPCLINDAYGSDNPSIFRKTSTSFSPAFAI